MGYYVSTERSDISICDETLFVECVKRLFSPENIAKYGETYSWGDDGSVVKSLKFIDPDDVRMAFIRDSLARIFDLFGYVVNECGDGSIQISKDGSGEMMNCSSQLLPLLLVTVVMLISWVSVANVGDTNTMTVFVISVNATKFGGYSIPQSN